ncbi:MAG: hypothetical protein R3296_12250 [Oleiphilaceae bacterium]|nr:hypothetical protein [Oleiphilaceae bacterium]
MASSNSLPTATGSAESSGKAAQPPIGGGSASQLSRERLWRSVPTALVPATVLVLAALLLSGCRTYADPEQPSLIGTPPGEAYLGVDYFYNFGASGGDDLLTFNLSNAPPWLALENTRNKARKGIVLRGQPGITGGRRGEKDLGVHNTIRITSNDGERLGGDSFSIRVRHNPLKVQDSTMEEGKASAPDAENDNGADSVCERPDMTETREVEVVHRRLATADGEFQKNVTRTYEAFPVLLEVRLEKPSVEPVVVHFELRDNFSPGFDGSPGSADCPSGTGEGDIPCEYRSRNQGRAIYGEDFVLNSGRFSAPPDYLQFLEEFEQRGTGLLTFEPGVTRCFIRAEVFNDNLAESDEGFTLELLEVREGIASLTRNNAIHRGRFEIRDNTPRVTLSPEKLTQSRGVTRRYSARLSAPNPLDQPLLAWLERDGDRSDALDEDFTLIRGNQQGDRILLSFPPDQEEVTFQLRLDANNHQSPRKLDELLSIRADVAGQFGREFFARSQDTRSDVSINEWTRSLSITDFIPTSLAAGAFGELYVTGLSGNNSQLNLWSVNRLGDTDTAAEDTERLIDSEPLEGSGLSPRVSFAQSERGTSETQRLRRDLVLGLSTDGPFAGQDGSGVMDIGLVFYRSLVGDPDGNGNDDLQAPFPDMEEFWRLRQGSPGDDRLQQVVMQTTERILLAGVTKGDWVDPASGEQERHQGQGDLLMAAIDTIQEGEGQFRGERAWTRVVGSPQQERLAGMGETLRNEFRLFGSSEGEVISGDALGLEDFVFTSINQDGSRGRSLQFGTQERDRFSVATVSRRTVWGAGASRVNYRQDPDERTPRLLASPGLRDSDNPFVFAANQLGNMVDVMVLESADPLSNQTVSAIVASDADVFVAGETDGSFVEGVHGGGAYLLMVNRDETINPQEDEPRLSEVWRIQIPDVARVLDLSIHDDRKLFMLVEMASGEHRVRLYNRLGELLTD